MATPLFKAMKAKGTTFYTLPSSASDMNNDFQNNNYNINFTKFILLNIPEQVNVNGDQTKGVLNIDKSQNGPLFYNFQPQRQLSTDFSEQLVESLRNYVANYDETLHQSRININTDFYNINEKVTPTEMIFWKWCRKMNLIDLEPAIHKLDWDKNLSDFDNNNGSDQNFFQKYLWKERDINYYSATLQQGVITINSNTKFKVGDNIILSGSTGSVLSANTSYEISTLTIDNNITTINLKGVVDTDSTPYTIVAYLNYHKLIQYIGEVQAVSKVQTSRANYTEVTAHIPHQAGKTPTVLFDVVDNSNYYPGLEMPILPSEQQEEIVGAENINSPIRLNPNDYPGTQFGYFDTNDKTYKCSNGDKIRNKGSYYGILLNNNIGLADEKYFEKLSDFNSNDIDGLKIDFDRDHYMKMNLANNPIKNFDEFNSTSFDNTAPEDFDFNTIVWYYDIDDGSGNIITNIYGIEFLNNPKNDDDTCDVDNKLITPYKKLVSNGKQDGLSYIFNLNVNYNIDNDSVPMGYDPTTVYNQFGFDLYQNILQTNAKLQDNFITIISGFTSLNEELFNVKSMVYSQTDITKINKQIDNLNKLLELYSTFQFIDSSSALITTNYEGVYPTLQVDVINTKYDTITDINTSDIFKYNETNSGNSYVISVPLTNQLLLNINNNNNDINGTAKLLLNNDLSTNQELEIYIQPSISASMQNLDINLRFSDGTTTTEQNLISGIKLPTDLINYNTLDITASTYSNSYYTNDSLSLIASKNIITGSTITTLNVKDDVYVTGDYIYIDNFYLTNGSIVTDYSGVYQISANTNSILSGNISITGDTYISGATTFDTSTNNLFLSISLNSSGLSLRSNPKISYYKGMKISVLRVSSLDSSSITDRYKITKHIL